MKHGLTIILALALLGCADNNVTPSTDLTGRWVDVNTKTDTLTFTLVGDEEMMILDRGKETRDGVVLPKYGSGPYDYELLNDEKISLRWVLSANSGFNDYHFRQSGDVLTIGRFFDATSSGTVLTFRRLD